MATLFLIMVVIGGAGIMVYRLTSRSESAAKLADAPLPSASWVEAQDGARSCVVERDALVAFCRSLGLTDPPSFDSIDPVVSGKIYQFLEQLDKNRGDAELLRKLGDLYQRHDFPEAAAGAYRRAIEIEDRYDFHYLLARVHLVEGRLDEAVTHLRRTLELNPDYSAAWYHLAEQMLASGRLDEAQEAYEHLVATPNASSGYLGMALVAKARNELDTAAQNLKRALGLDPTNYRAHFQLALVYQQMGRSDLYAHHFGRYQSLPQRIKLDDPLLTRVMLSAVTPHLVREVAADLSMQGREEEALRFLTRAVEDRPRHPELLEQIALTESRVNRASQALETIEQCIKLDPANVSAWTTKSRICLAMGDWEGARNSAERAIALDASRAYAHFLRGQALRGEGRREESVESYAAASQIDPDNFSMAVALAETLFELERYKEAKEAYLRADRAKAGDARITHRLDQIERAVSTRGHDE